MKHKKALAGSLLLLLLLLSPTIGQAQENGPVYIVQAGDTLSGIARTFGLSIDTLMQANSLSNPNSIAPGQELVLPGFSGIQGVLTTAQIEAGQTLPMISARLGADWQAIARLNRVLHPGRLYLGQSLILPQNSESVASPLKPLLVTAGKGLIQYSAERGDNPWSAAQVSGDSARLWWVPGEWAIVPAEANETGRLPGGVSLVEVKPERGVQGETMVIRVQTQPEAQVSGRLADWNLNFVQAEAEEQLALQGINALLEPGLYDLTLQWSTAEGGQTTGFSQPYPIRSGEYGFDPVLIVPEETVGEENTVPEDELVADLVAPVTPEKRWQGAFAWPSNHWVESFPSVFGTRRNYNNTGYNFYHTGLDFFGGVGVEIVAPAPGRVVFSDELIVRGLTTVIDHGWGVYSIYMHQSESKVEPEQEVDTGQVIGLVGASGRVTGAHLHWEIRVGGVPVQPLDWVEQTFP